jgi:DMSO/TMAO reductase YedYZ molybdopterin-dependent catalytic subunit
MSLHTDRVRQDEPSRFQGQISSAKARTARENRSLFLSGALAALVMTVFMIAIRSFSQTESLAELIAEVVIQIMPIGLFSFFLQQLGSLAKPLLLGSVMAGMILAGGWIALLDGGAARRYSVAKRIRRISTLVLFLWIPLVIVALLVTTVMPLFPLGSGELVSLAVMLALNLSIYASALYLVHPILSGLTGEGRADSPPENLGRRKLLGQAGTAALAVAGGLYLGSFLRSTRSGSQGSSDGVLSTPITPNEDFYTVSKNFVDPRVDADGWELEITGLVANPTRLNYRDLLALPSTVEQMSTLMCISNPVGGDLIGNAVWTGVRLSDLLEPAGVISGATTVAFFGDDGYSDSFSLEKALEPTTIVAYLMNGEPLPDDHGFPARLIVPGKYGIKNGKWLTRLQLTENYRGYWQQRGWTNEARIKTMSRFDLPETRSIVPFGPVELGGVAFAGDRGIQRVEVSTDDGGTWRDVDQLETVGPLSWSIWRMIFDPPETGAYRLKVRATDGTGEVQTSDRADPTPDGASGYHTITIGVT